MAEQRCCRHTSAAVNRLGGLAVLAWMVVRLGFTPAGAATVFDPAWPRTDFGMRSVDLAEIVSGGPPKDGIPALDRPCFVTPEQAAAWLDPREPVISVESHGTARAYPLQILIYHEIVNDTVGGEPLAITFCPLCNAALVYERRIAGRVLDFGTTGLLRKSDLVMYDRQTESWWQQFTGVAIVGELNGMQLRQVSAPIVAYASFRDTYPDGLVLARDTGYARPYGRNPYRGYDRIGNLPFLMRDPVDPRLPAMERVLAVSHHGRHRLYPFTALRAAPVINDRLDAVPVVVFSRDGVLSALDESVIRDSRSVSAATAYRRDPGGRLLSFERRHGGIYDRETDSRWNLFGVAVDGPLRGERLVALPGGVHFAFAWLAFRPQSEIYRVPWEGG